jgi:hypothetical protein
VETGAPTNCIVSYIARPAVTRPPAPSLPPPPPSPPPSPPPQPQPSPSACAAAWAPEHRARARDRQWKSVTRAMQTQPGRVMQPPRARAALPSHPKLSKPRPALPTNPAPHTGQPSQAIPLSPPPQPSKPRATLPSHTYGGQWQVAQGGDVACSAHLVS